MNFIQYIKQAWKAGSSGGTPLSPDRLNHMEDGIKNNNDMISELNNNTFHFRDKGIKDFNKISQMGIYTINGAVATNAPNTGYNGWYDCIVLAHDYNENFLFCITFSDNGIWIRSQANSNWNNWVKI